MNNNQVIDLDWTYEEITTNNLGPTPCPGGPPSPTPIPPTSCVLCILVPPPVGASCCEDPLDPAPWS